MVSSCTLFRVAASLLLLAGLLAGPAAAAIDRPDEPTDEASIDHDAAPAQRFQWPLAGRPAVVRDFDPPPQPWGSGHRGVDLAGVAGEPVFAAASGTVIYAGPLAGRGVVSIEHPGGLRTTYEPVQPVVQPGQRVTAGQRIGTLAAGHPECAAAACLHWGLRRDEQVYLDPLWVLAPAPLRLLPWNGLG